MNLKTSTLFAIIGSILGIISSVYHVLLSLEVVFYSQGAGLTINLLNAFSMICFLVFFITLYSNQNK